MSQSRQILRAWCVLYMPDISDDAFTELEHAVNELLRMNARSAFPLTPATQSAIETLCRVQLITFLRSFDPDHTWYWNGEAWQATLITEHHGGSNER